MHINRPFARFVLILALILCSGPLFAQRKITIKLASLVPENTPWGAAINKLSKDWADATNGEVELVVYHSGVAGDEAEVLRKLKLNQIQAAIFTSGGLNSIMPEVMALSYPFLIRNNAELDAVLEKLKPELDAKIQQNGFVTLAWARAGWVKVFSRSPVYTPADLRRLKLGTSPEELQMIQAFKTMGYQMIPVKMNDILVSLNGGMIDAVYQSPVAVAGYQIFGIAKNMMDFNVAPFMGGILMNQAAWRRIPERYKPKLQSLCKQVEIDVGGSIANLETEAVTTMGKYGLIINQPSAQQIQEWYTETDKYKDNLVGPIFNREFYQKIDAVLQDYRTGSGAKGR
jgi:TRAP-type C4-dicarboxylate transport system substrate-binding protein